MARDYQRELRALSEALREVARMSPAAAMLRLNEMLNTTGEDSVLAGLRQARRSAARDAVDDAGSQAKLARELGVSEMIVSRALRAESRRYR